VPREPLSTDQIVSILAGTPGRIAAATADLTPQQLRTQPGADDWSANDVLAHLRACADMWNSSIYRMISEDRPTIRAVNPRTWIKQTDYRDIEFAPSFAAFRAQRAELLSVLETLPAEAWFRSATVTGAGAPLERTVLTYGDGMARHERPHVKQIERIVDAVRS
jgi:hypothetical protein